MHETQSSSSPTAGAGSGGSTPATDGSAWDGQKRITEDAGVAVGPGPTDPRSWVGPEETSRLGVRSAPVPSLAAIGGHPLHPMVVPLPIGALALALVADLAHARSADPFWARTSQFLLATGVGTGAFAAVLGATDFVGREKIRERPEAWLHAGGNVAAMGLSMLNLAIRGRDGRRAAMPAGLLLSTLTGAILLGTGWLGGELSYRHRIGVTSE